MSQCAELLAYLQSGHTITALEAFHQFGILALHSRAAELRERGFPITCELVKTPSGKRVVKYSWAGERV